MFRTANGTGADCADPDDVESSMLMFGHLKTVPLNGGSDTRRDMREYYLDYACWRGLPAECLGNCLVRIGWSVNGRVPRTWRGMRYVRHGHRLVWWNRRKFRKWQRKHAGAITLLSQPRTCDTPRKRRTIRVEGR